MLSLYEDGGGGGYGGVPVYLFADSEEPRAPHPGAEEPRVPRPEAVDAPPPTAEEAQTGCGGGQAAGSSGSIVIEVTVPQLLAFSGIALLLAWVLALQAKVAHLARLLEGARRM